MPMNYTVRLGGALPTKRLQLWEWSGVKFLKTTGKAIIVGAATLVLSGKIVGENECVRVGICGYEVAATITYTGLQILRRCSQGA
jgi:hypothetical protein